MQCVCPHHLIFCLFWKYTKSSFVCPLHYLIQSTINTKAKLIFTNLNREELCQQMLNISHYKCIVLALPSSCANTFTYHYSHLLAILLTWGKAHHQRWLCHMEWHLVHAQSEVAAVLSAVQVEGAKVTCHSFIGVRLLLPHAHIQISSVTPWQVSCRCLKRFHPDP